MSRARVNCFEKGQFAGTGGFVSPVGSDPDGPRTGGEFGPACEIPGAEGTAGNEADRKPNRIRMHIITLGSPGRLSMFDNWRDASLSLEWAAELQEMGWY